VTRFLLLTTNRSGVLSRIISIVSSTGANIESAVAYPAGDSGFSVVHLVSDNSPILRERLVRKLSRLVDVIECSGTDKSANITVDLPLHLKDAKVTEVIAPGARQ
jgi:acetolactate synthase small subunit